MSNENYMKEILMKYGRYNKQNFHPEYFTRYFHLLEITNKLEKELFGRDDYFIDRDGDVSFMSGNLEVKSCKQFQINKDVVEAFNVIKDYLEKQK